MNTATLKTGLKLIAVLKENVFLLFMLSSMWSVQ